MQFVLLVNRIAPDYRPRAQSESPLGTASYPSSLQQSFSQATLSIINEGKKLGILHVSSPFPFYIG